MVIQVKNLIQAELKEVKNAIYPSDMEKQIAELEAKLPFARLSRAHTTGTGDTGYDLYLTEDNMV